MADILTYVPLYARSEFADLCYLKTCVVYHENQTEVWHTEITDFAELKALCKEHNWPITFFKNPDGVEIDITPYTEHNNAPSITYRGLTNDWERYTERVS